ncbi:DUF2284 domain-containing protein [Chloroflexota bacterium]
MVDKSRLESIFNKYEYTDFKWIDPKEIVTAQWVRNKCKFGCYNYGKRACCPPNLPPVFECRQFFDEYVTAMIFHFPETLDKPEDRHEWGWGINHRLLSMEREVFLSGYQKTFLLPMAPCRICEECTAAKEDCKNPTSARPTPEGMAIDVYSTVRKYGFPIEVVSDYSQEINKYAFLLIE